MIGIYAIRNAVTRRVYVGSSVRIAQRFASHRYRLRRNTHANKHLQSSWNKHGESAFLFEVLEVLPSTESLMEREQFHANEAKPLIYNQGKFVLNPMLGVKFSIEQCKAIGDRSRGIPRSQEFAANQSDVRRKWWSIHKQPTDAMRLAGKKNAAHAQAVLRSKTHCRNGHSYMDAYRDKGARRCRTCQRLAFARYTKRKSVSVG